jgi:hypothetical protein
MRTVSVIHVDKASLVARGDSTVEVAALELVKALLHEERLLPPESNPIVRRDQILAGWRDLSNTRGDGDLPTDPESKLIHESAAAVLKASLATGSRQTMAELFPDPEHNILLESEETALQYRVLRHVISILAQIPSEERESVYTDLVTLVYDRDAEVVGTLFQRGTTFTLRVRHRNPDTLKSVTERFINVLAPRSENEIDDVVRKIPALERVRERFDVQVEPITMKTPAGEQAQIGHVHVVGSQLKLLAYLAIQSPQTYLLLLTGTFLGLDLLFELRLVPDMSIRDLSLREWSAGNFARLATAAAGAYLVALFLRFAELRRKLRSSARRRRGLLRSGSAYGAFIEWRTE